MLARLFGREGFKRLAMQALVLLGLVVLAIGLAVSFYYVPLPNVGFDFVGGTHIGAVEPGRAAAAAGVQVGDKVLSIESEAPWPGNPYLRPGQEMLRLTAQRDDQVIPLEVELSPPSLAEFLEQVSYFLIALAYWAIAMIVLFLKPRDSVSQVFVLVTLLGTLGIVIWPMADLGARWANFLMPVVALAAGPLFVHYNTLFPERIEFRSKKLLMAGLYIASLTLLLLSTASDLVFYLWFEGQGDWPPSLAPLTKIYFSLCLLLGLGLLARTRYVTRSETSRRQISIVMFGTALALLPLILLIFLPQVLFTSYVVPPWVSLLMLAFIPLSYLYATYRHNLMDLDGMVNRSVALFLLAVILASLYLGLSLVSQWLLPDLFAGSITPAEVVLFVVLVLLLEPLRRRIERWVDRVFYGGWYNYETFISHMSEAFKDTVEMQTVVHLLVNDVADTMRLKAIAVLCQERKERSFSVRGSKGFTHTSPISRESALAAFLLEQGKPVPHPALRNHLRRDPAAQEEFMAWSEAGAQIWVPLVQQRRLVGLLILGGKQADDFFYRVDHRILATIAQQAAVAIVRVQLVDELQAQVEEVQALAGQVMALQERNQQQMALDLHDQVIHDVLSARYLLDDAQERFLPEEIRSAREILAELLAYLRAMLFELQPPAWEHSDLQTLLEDYICNYRRRSRLPVVFEANGAGEEIFVPEEVRVATYRILQESLNNSRKHAQAKQVEVALDLRPGYVRLEIRDDGVGFQVPDLFGPYVRRNRLGLMGMHIRAQRVGGALQLESQPGLGTRVFVEVPWSIS